MKATRCGGAVIAGVLLSWASWSAGPRLSGAVTRGVDLNRVAVLPFSSPQSPEMLDLRDWLQDLLVDRLTGEGTPRAVAPAAVADAMRRYNLSSGAVLSPDATARLQTDLGAGLLLRGGVAGSLTRFRVAATLGARIETVSGNADSLPYLADQLVVRLLAARAGDTEDRAALATTSLAALRAYLAGRQAYGRGLVHESEEYFDRALLLDSTFAPAALGVAILQSTFHWWGGGDERWLADACWRKRRRMTPADRALLTAILGPHYPGPSTEAEMLAAAELATRIGPDEIEAWNQYARDLVWFGRDLGIADWRKRSIAAFHRAFAIDSTHALTLEFLIRLAADAGDTAEVRRALAIYVASNPHTERQASLEWMAADALGDSVARQALRVRFDTLGVTDLLRINWFGEIRGGAALQDARMAVKALLTQTSGTPGNRGLVMYRQLILLLNEGRPTQAGRVVDQFKIGSYAWPEASGPREFHLFAAMFGDGNRSEALAAARQLEASLDHSPQTTQCTLAEWRAASGDREGARAAMARLGPLADRGDYFGVPGTELCAAVVEAMVTAGSQRGAAAALRRLDSLLRAPWWNGDDLQLTIGDLVAAHLHEVRGDLPGALELVRRLGDPQFLSTKLREEGRLAALVGDTAGAIRAYRRYLELRSDPEPALRPQVEHVRMELRRLETSTPDARAAEVSRDRPLT